MSCKGGCLEGNFYADPFAGRQLRCRVCRGIKEELTLDEMFAELEALEEKYRKQFGQIPSLASKIKKEIKRQKK